MRDNAAEIDRLAVLLAKDPQSKAFLPLAEEYGKAGMWQEAAAVLEDGLKVYPAFVTAMVALGHVYDKLGQAVKAKTLLEDAVTRSPDNLRAHRMLAKLYAAQGAVEDARRSCSMILSLSPQDQDALALLDSLESPRLVPRAEHAEEASDSVDASKDSEHRTPTSTQAATVARLEVCLRRIQSRRKRQADRQPLHQSSR